MAIVSIVSVQCGAALATTLFDSVGPLGRRLPALRLRGRWPLSCSPAPRHRPLAAGGPARPWDVVLFGVSLAALNLCFYAALDRLPLGIAVTLEFVGPLGGRGPRLAPAPRLALGAARRGRNRAALRWHRGRWSSDALGVALALAAGGFWLSLHPPERLRRRQPPRPFGGLALAAAISAVIVAPFGIVQGGAELLAPVQPGDRPGGRAAQLGDPLHAPSSRLCAACRKRSSGRG